MVVRGVGVLSFCNGCGNEEGLCNGRGKQGKGVGDLLHFAKPAKRSLKGKSVGDFR